MNNKSRLIITGGAIALLLSGAPNLATHKRYGARSPNLGDDCQLVNVILLEAVYKIGLLMPHHAHHHG